MALSRQRFTAHNVRGAFEHHDDVCEYFSLSAPPDSKIWRTLRGGDVLSAPMILCRLDSPFAIAEVTICAAFEEIWDQAGLILFMDMGPDDPWTSPAVSHRRRTSLARAESQHQGKWAKAGLQLYGDDIGLATVVAHPKCGPDMSIVKVSTDFGDRPGFASHTTSLRVKLERVGDDLWAWYRTAELSRAYLTPAEASGEWTCVREICGFFAGADDKSTIMVGCYASRPIDLEEEERKDLVVEFEDLGIL